MPTYCVTARGIQLPWFNLSVRGPSASPPSCSIKRVSEDAPAAPACRLRAAGAQRARRGCHYAVCLPAAVPPRPHPAGSLQRGHPVPRGEQRGERTSLHFSANFSPSRCASLSSVPIPTAPGHRTDINTRPCIFVHLPVLFSTLCFWLRNRGSLWGAHLAGVGLLLAAAAPDRAVTCSGELQGGAAFRVVPTSSRCLPAGEGCWRR